MPFEKIWEIPGFREASVHQRPPDPPRNPDPPGKSTVRASESVWARPPPDVTHPDVTHPAAGHRAAAHRAAMHRAAMHRAATADVMHPSRHPPGRRPRAGVSTVADRAPLLVRHE